MTGLSHLVTYQQLPDGYPRSLRAPPREPVTPRAAATLALLRKGSEGLEVLLLRRSHRSRFLPGAYVFPGGRVDADDASEEMLALLSASLPSEATPPPPLGFGTTSGKVALITALRETFEEAGILLTRGGARSFPMVEGKGVEGLRRALHDGRKPFPLVLAAIGEGLDGGRLNQIGHWMTPVQERYRYDTRFFGAEVPQDCQAYPDGKEMVEALWLSPEKALGRNRGGTLPMVFPTLLTLEALLPFATPSRALDALGKKEIRRLLPMVEDTGDGIRAVFEAIP